LGHSVKVLTRIGTDDLANLITAKLREENINLELVQYGNGKTGLSAVLVADGGGRSIITYRGESGLIASREVNWNEIEKADWIQVSSLGGNIELLEDLVSFANLKKIGIGINPGKGELDHKDRIISLLPKINFMNVNRMEASILWGVDFDNEEEIMKRFAESKSIMVAVTDGKRGASILKDGKWIKMAAYPNKSIDDTGAGDAFVSGAVYGILDGRPIEDVLKMGLANGGSTVMVLGAKDGLLYKDDMEKWIKKQLKSVEVML